MGALDEYRRQQRMSSLMGMARERMSAKNNLANAQAGQIRANTPGYYGNPRSSAVATQPLASLARSKLGQVDDGMSKAQNMWNQGKDLLGAETGRAGQMSDVLSKMAGRQLSERDRADILMKQREMDMRGKGTWNRRADDWGIDSPEGNTGGNVLNGPEFGRSDLHQPTEGGNGMPSGAAFGDVAKQILSSMSGAAGNVAGQVTGQIASGMQDNVPMGAMDEKNRTLFEQIGRMMRAQGGNNSNPGNAEKAGRSVMDDMVKIWRKNNQMDDDPYMDEQGFPKQGTSFYNMPSGTGIITVPEGSGGQDNGFGQKTGRAGVYRMNRDGKVKYSPHQNVNGQGAVDGGSGKPSPALQQKTSYENRLKEIQKAKDQIEWQRQDREKHVPGSAWEEMDRKDPSGKMSDNAYRKTIREEQALYNEEREILTNMANNTRKYLEGKEGPQQQEDKGQQPQAPTLAEAAAQIFQEMNDPRGSNPNLAEAAAQIFQEMNDPRGSNPVQQGQTATMQTPVSTPGYQTMQTPTSPAMQSVSRQPQQLSALMEMLGIGGQGGGQSSAGPAMPVGAPQMSSRAGLPMQGQSMIPPGGIRTAPGIPQYAVEMQPGAMSPQGRPMDAAASAIQSTSREPQQLAELMQMLGIVPGVPHQDAGQINSLIQFLAQKGGLTGGQPNNRRLGDFYRDYYGGSR